MEKVVDIDMLDDFGKNANVVRDPYLNDEPCVVEEISTELRESRNKDLIGFKQWAYHDKNVFTPARITRPKLENGYYELKMDNHGILYFNKKNIETDEILDFTQGPSKNLIEEIKDFWTLEDNFKKYNFIHRRGFLLYGPAGSGKTMTINLIIKDIIERDGVVITSQYAELYSQGTTVLREIEPDRKIVCIFEDIDTMVERKSSEDHLLKFLDGDNQIGNVLNIATTNYPERLDKRIVARPRRFDRVIKIDYPEESVRNEYLKKKLLINGEELKKWTKETNNLSFAALADLVISVKCLGNDYETTLIKLKKLCDSKFDSDEYYKNKKIGFDQD